jgi:hypothetical protein
MVRVGRSAHDLVYRFGAPSEGAGRGAVRIKVIDASTRTRHFATRLPELLEVTHA